MSRVSADWFNGIGLCLNMLGTLLWFFYGVPASRPLEDVGKSYYVMEGEPDQAELGKARRIAQRSRAGLVLLFLGFTLQLIAVVK